MILITPSADCRLRAQAAALVSSKQAYGWTGLILATVLPACFWVFVEAGIGHAVGIAIPASTLTATGAAIVLFLGYVCAPIMLRAS